MSFGILRMAKNVDSVNRTHTRSRYVDCGVLY